MSHEYRNGDDVYIMPDREEVRILEPPNKTFDIEIENGTLLGQNFEMNIVAGKCFVKIGGHDMKYIRAIQVTAMVGEPVVVRLEVVGP